MPANPRFVPRGSADPNRDLAVAAALVLAGALVPVGVSLLAHDLLALYLTGGTGLALAAGGFGLCLWLVVEWRDLDRPNVVVASVLAPTGLFAVVLLLAPLGLFDLLPAHLGTDIAGVVGYLAAFGAAGIGAVGLSRALDATGHAPDSGRVAAVVAAVLLVGAALGGGVNYAAAQSATVTEMEAGLAPVSDPALNVTVAGANAELRVTVVDPTGTAVTQRLSRAETADGRATAAVRLWNDASPPPGYLTKTSGRYRVRVTTLAGVTVDTATFTADPGVGLDVVETASARGPLPWNRSSRGSSHETRVGVAVANSGAFHTTAVATVDAPGRGDPNSGTYFLGPGESAAIVVGIPEATVERLRANGTDTVTVTVWQTRHETEALVTVEIPLPPPG